MGRESNGPRPDVVVVGAGVVGCAIAYYLARAGARVQIVEREQVAAGASQAAAGMLAPMAEAHEPGPFLTLALAGHRLFADLAPALREETGLDIELQAGGILRLATNAEECMELEARLQWQRERGLPISWLEPEEARRLEPLIAPDILAAALSPEESQVSAPRLTRALAVAAARRGVVIRERTPVVGLLTSKQRVHGVLLPDGQLEADQVVLAMGAWAGLAGPWFDFKVPVAPVRGQVLALRTAAPPLRHIIWAGHRYIVPKVDGTVIVGATEEHVGFDTRGTASAVGYLLGGLGSMVPGLADAEFERAWAGLRPWSETGEPILGPVPGWSGLTLAAGHFRNGILLGPITGLLTAEAIRSGTVPEAIAAFSPARLLVG